MVQLAELTTPPATAALPSWNAERALAALDRMPRRLTDKQLDTAKRIARLPCPRLEPAAPGDLEDALLVLMATLPKQTAGEVDGVLRVEGYLRVLRGLSLPQVEFMRDTALAECEWMPSPAKLLEIARRWNRGDEAVRAVTRAEAMVRRELNARLDDTRRALRVGELTQEAIDVLPEHWAKILECESLLLEVEPGRYVARKPLLSAEGGEA